MQLDTAKYSEDKETAKRAEELVALLTPVAKAFLTDMGLETTVHGQQIFGGHGFIREWGQEQLIRDCRITQIYEGTNGIQSLDLMGHQDRRQRRRLQAPVRQIKGFVAADASLAEFTGPLKAAVENLDALTAWVIAQAKANPNEIGAASVGVPARVRLHRLRLHVGPDGPRRWARKVRTTSRQQAGHRASSSPASLPRNPAR